MHAAIRDWVGSDGFYELRFESIGGLGAHLAGQMLAEAGVLRQGLNGSHFSSYGSEKKGTPVKSFVRFCDADRAIRVSSPVETPQLVAIFHAALADSPASVAGLVPGGTAIVNTTSSPDAIRRTLELDSATVATLDALGIAVEEKTRVNTAMLGAIVSACPFIDPDSVRETIRATFSRRHPEVVDANVRTFDRGYHELRRDAGRPSLAVEARRPYGPPRPSATSKLRSAASFSSRRTASRST